MIPIGCVEERAPAAGAESGTAGPSNPYAKVVTPAERARLTNLYCGACHNVGGKDHDDLLAPPLVAIRRRYQMAYPEREAFIAAIIDFTHNAASQKALLRGPVDRFGAMPAMPHVPVDELREIAIHIFEGEIEIPAWWESHREEMRGQGGYYRNKGRNGTP